MTSAPDTNGGPAGHDAAAPFADVLTANGDYRARFTFGDVPSVPRRRLAVVTCMDARLDLFAILGLEPGDAKVIRNAGGRVTEDALRSLVLATALLNVNRVAVIQHTDCAMTRFTESELRGRIAEVTGTSAEGWAFHTIGDHAQALRGDVDRVRACTLLGDDLAVGGFLYDVTTGALDQLV